MNGYSSNSLLEFSTKTCKTTNLVFGYSKPIDHQCLILQVVAGPCIPHSNDMRKISKDMIH